MTRLRCIAGAVGATLLFFGATVALSRLSFWLTDVAFPEHANWTGTLAFLWLFPTVAANAAAMICTIAAPFFIIGNYWPHDAGGR